MFFKREKLLVKHPVMNYYSFRWVKKFDYQKAVSVLLTVLLIFQIISGIFLFVPPPKPVQAAWWDNSWNYKKKLTFDNSGQSENLTNFPVLVKLTAANFDFTKAQSNGEDIRFVDSDETTALKYEIEKWDNSAQEAYIWVKVPQIDGSSSTDYIYMYYGNGSASDAQDAENVWDANFVMVQHFQETTGNHLDSTSNNNDTDTVSVTSQGTAAGKIGGADEFVRSSSDYVEVPHSSTLDLITYTIEFWFKADTPSVAIQSLVARGEDWTNDIAQWVIELDDAQNPDKIQLWYEESNDADHYYPTNTSISADTWYYFTVTRDESGNENIIYLQGEAENTNSDTTTPGSVSTPVTIGARRNAPSTIQDYFDGIIDEVRISNTARSADWIKASYLSETDAFITFGEEETLGVASISSATNQSFGVGDGATSISPITITDAATPTITAANDIYVIIPSTFNMTWDTSDTSPTFGGTASDKVNSTVSYVDKDGNSNSRHLKIDVTSDFAAGDTLTISDLSFTNFTAESSTDNLELDTDADGTADATDDKTITIVAPEITIASSTSQPSYLSSPSQDTVLGSISIVRNVSTGSVTAVTIKENGGTIDAQNDMENIELWLSSDDSWDAGDEQIGTTSNFDGADGEITFSESFNVSTTTQYLIVRGDIKSGVISGKTFELQFKTITTTDSVSGQPLNISGTSTISPYWWNSNWLYRKTLTFDNSGQAENLTNFPVLVKLTNSNFDFSKAQSSGQDLRFVDADNSTQLSHEIEYYDTTGETAVIWVKIPQIDGSSNTDFIYMYYGNAAAADGQNITDVWSNNFAAVYHFAEQNGYYQDSTSNNNDANTQQVTSRDNMDANGLGYYPKFVAASGDYVGVPDDTSLQFGSGDFTILVRANASSDLTDTDLIRKGSTNTADPDSWWKLEWGTNVTNQVRWEVRVSGTAKQAKYTKTPDGNWHNFWGTRDTTNNLVELFIDGSQVASVEGISGSVDPTTSTNIGIGSKDTYDDDHFNGYLDDVRFSNTLRSADWIAAQHLSLENTFITYGSEVQGLPNAPSGCSATRDSDTQFTITWTDNSSNETGFKIERNTNDTGWSQIGTVSADTTSFVDNSTNNPTDPPQTNEKYQYRVRAYNNTGNSDYSTDPNVLYTTPSAPSGVSAAYVSDREITVSFTDNSAYEDGFKIERKTDDGSWSQIATLTSSPYSDTNTSVNHKYEYRVRAYKDSLNSDYATASSPVYTTPSAPTIGSPAVDSSTAIIWTWTDNSNYENSFRLDFVTGEGTDLDNISANSTSYQTTGLTANTQYSVHIHAYRSDRGESSASDTSAAVYTLAPTPTNLIASSVSTNSITLSVDSFPNDTSGSSGYYFENTTTGSNSGWIQTNSWQDTGLSCGTSYTYTVKYRNGDGVETDTISLIQSTDSCGGGGMPSAWFNPPKAPEQGFKILINNDAKYTDNPTVTLNLFGGPDAAKMAISNNPEFSGAGSTGQITYQSSYQWNLCQGRRSCSEGEYIVYVKFYASWGKSSGVVSDSIIYQKEIPEEKPIAKLPPPKVKPPTEKPKKPFIEKVPEILKPLVPEFLKPKPPEVVPEEIPIEELVPKETPLVFQGKWDLLPQKPIKKFVLAPLPKEIRTLAEKFPELGQTLKKVGITKITDIKKLKTVKLTLPGLTERVGLPTQEIQPGKFALPKGVPVAKLSPEIKQKLPTEIVFAKTAGELIDFNIALTIGEKGEPQQKIATISGKPLQLVVKPERPVKSIKGYLVFKSKKPRPTSFQFPFNHLAASLIFANPVFVQPQDKPVRIEEKLVLLEFEYTDPDGDGIYTAEIKAPLVEGEYEIITVMDFEDPALGKKEIRLITVVDPEGYIYEKDGNKETRIPGAIVSLFWLNPETKQYELWPAKEYQQENPQITDATGKYSFLVPEGSYYLKVEAPGYLMYDGKLFQVKEGSGVHINIELKTKYWWLKIVDWKIIVMIIFGALLLYNFYRDKIREKLLRKQIK